MQIGIVQQSADFIGGGELSLFELIHALKESGHKPFVIIPSRGEISKRLEKEKIPYVDHPFREWVVEPGVVRLTGGINRRISYLFMEGNIIANAIRIKGLTPDLIITNTLNTPVGAFAALAMAIPHIWYIREFGSLDVGYEYEIPEKMVYRLINKLSEHCITNSRAVKYFVRNMGIDDEKISVARQAVDVKPGRRVDLPGPQYYATFICVGRIEVSKGQLDAVKAVNIIKKKGTNTKLIIMGKVIKDWPDSIGYYNRIVKYIKKNKLENNIFFIGYKKNSSDYIKSSFATIVCSRNEAFGRVAIESMKLGIPVIGADSAGTAENITNRETGLLYEPGNPRHLAKKMMELSDDLDLYKSISEYSIKSSHDRFNKEIYGRCLSTIIDDMREY